jgi:Spy/CpxP family protein refolding chaperone
MSEEERQEAFADMRGRAEKVVQSAQKDIDAVLLPHQRERLKQLNIQSQLRRQNTSDALTRGALATELNITDEQREKLSQMQEQVAEELRKEMEQLQQEAREKVLSVLTPEQRAKLTQLTGDSFQFSPPNFGGFGGGRGGPGGPGGRGGPGGPGGGRAPDGGGRFQRPADGD